MGFLLISIVAVVVGAVFAVKFWYQFSIKKCRSTRRLEGKTVIVTGANTGIGKETARDLARRGARVIMACRDMRRGNEARADIVQSTGNSNVAVSKLDLGSLQSVRAFVQDFLATEQRLDVLVNNAAATHLENKVSADGLQQEMQINHFGPFLLTILLLDILKKSAPSRIVNVSALVHRIGKCELDNLNCEKSYPGDIQLYSNAKLFNVLFSNELARRLAGTGVTSNSLHPGVVQTELIRGLPGIFRVFMSFFIGFLCMTPSEGAQTSVHVAVCEEMDKITGRYFSDCKIAKMSADAQNGELARKLWDKSVELVKLKPEEIKLD